MKVRRETLMNLEHYDVLGHEKMSTTGGRGAIPSGKCYTTKEVDGRLMSIPCHLVNDFDDGVESK